MPDYDATQFSAFRFSDAWPFCPSCKADALVSRYVPDVELEVTPHTTAVRRGEYLSAGVKCAECRWKSKEYGTDVNIVAPLDGSWESPPAGTHDSRVDVRFVVDSDVRYIQTNGGLRPDMTLDEVRAHVRRTHPSNADLLSALDDPTVTIDIETRADPGAPYTPHRRLQGPPVVRYPDKDTRYVPAFTPGPAAPPKEYPNDKRYAAVLRGAVVAMCDNIAEVFAMIGGGRADTVIDRETKCYKYITTRRVETRVPEPPDPWPCRDNGEPLPIHEITTERHLARNVTWRERYRELWEVWYTGMSDEERRVIDDRQRKRAASMIIPDFHAAGDPPPVIGYAERKFEMPPALPFGEYEKKQSGRESARSVLLARAVEYRRRADELTALANGAASFAIDSPEEAALWNLLMGKYGRK